MEEPPSVASPHKRVELVAAECDQPEDTVFMHQRVRRTSVEAARPSACGATLDSARQMLRALRGWRLAGCLGAITVVALLAGLLGGLLPRPTGPAAVGRTPDLTASIVLTLGTRLGTTGEPKRCVLVNGTSPGPLLRVRKGDLVSVTLINELEDSTTLHFHGMRQHATPWFDGVPGVTQCPIGNTTGSNTMTFTFIAEPAGTYYYHAHFRQQLIDGFYAPFIVEQDPEPYAHLYTDEWVWLPADWHNANALPLAVSYIAAATPSGIEPVPDAYIVNGQFSGQFWQAASRNATVRVRLINAAGLSHFNFSVDGLPLTVIEVDNTPVQPYEVAWTLLNVAQRMSVLLDFSRLDAALAAEPAIWFRLQLADAEREATLAAGVTLPPEFRGAISFDGPTATPTYDAAPSTAQRFAPPSDDNMLAARPLWVALATPPPATHTVNISLAFHSVTNSNGVTINHGYVNGRSLVPPRAALLRSPLLFSFLVPVNKPFPFAVNDATQDILSAAAQQVGVLLPDDHGHIILPHMAVVEMMLLNSDAREHPMRIHGHAVWILATSAFPEAEDAFASGGYVQRDSITVPPATNGWPGWAKVRFVADNPGIWPLHCHIEWHMAAGMSVLLIEAPDVLQARADAGLMPLPEAQKRNCDAFALTLEAALVANWGTLNSAADPGR